MERLKIIILCSLFSMVFSDLSYASWSYSKKEENGYIVAYVEPQYEIDGKKYFVRYNDGLSNYSAMKFCKDQGYANPAQYSTYGTFDGKRQVEAVSFNAQGIPGVPHQSKQYMLAIFCANSISESSPSTYYADKTVHPDGSFTVDEPRFLYDGKLHFFHSIRYFWEHLMGRKKISPEAICKLYGGLSPVNVRIVYEPEDEAMDTSNWAWFFSDTTKRTENFEAFLSTDRGELYERVANITCTAW